MNRARCDWHADDDLWIETYSHMFPESRVAAAGFSSVDLYGDLAGGPYDSSASRMIAVARTGGA